MRETGISHVILSMKFKEMNKSKKKILWSKRNERMMKETAAISLLVPLAC